jgi:tRNA-splicing ligase RtcB
MAKDVYHGPLEKVDACCYRIPRSNKPGMRVDGLIFANEKPGHSATRHSASVRRTLSVSELSIAT